MVLCHLLGASKSGFIHDARIGVKVSFAPLKWNLNFLAFSSLHAANKSGRMGYQKALLLRQAVDRPLSVDRATFEISQF
jgi:hypothetical protein